MTAPPDRPTRPARPTNDEIAGLAVIGVGAVALLSNLGFISFNWHVAWPVVIIAVGVALLLRR